MCTGGCWQGVGRAALLVREAGSVNGRLLEWLEDVLMGHLSGGA